MCYSTILFLQIYNFFPTLMDHLPGPHQRLIENTETINDFILDIIAQHQKTLDPTCPRDFIDAFLNKMEQVMQEQEICWIRRKITA